MGFEVIPNGAIAEKTSRPNQQVLAQMMLFDFRGF
jgi:hypothetical protein